MLSLELEIAKIPTKKIITLVELYTKVEWGALYQGHRTKISGTSSTIETVAMSLRI